MCACLAIHTAPEALGWVPDEAEDAAQPSMRPKTAEIPTKVSTSLPLEYFDSPAMEAVQPQDRLDSVKAEAEAAGSQQPGAPARSRFYDLAGAFTWAACWALEYDQ